METTLFYILLILHILGDVTFQTKDQDLNKSTNNKKLHGHVMIYTLTIILPIILFSILGCQGFSIHSHYWLLRISLLSLITYFSHYYIDMYASRYIDYFWYKQKKNNFISIVLLDQIIHYILLFGSVYYLFFY